MPTPSPAVEPEWTILKLIQWAAGYLRGRGIDSPRATAEILLAHALNAARVRLYMDFDKPLQADELARFKEFIRRRLRREPVAYIVGRKGFWTLELSVSRDVLIPRPETECLVEAALARLARTAEGEARRVLELGTGSGAVILALASEAGRHGYLATDISPAAVALARANAREAGLADRVGFLVSDWFSAVKAQSQAFDLIVSNPPYVARPLLAGLQPEVAGHEPRLALDGDVDGLGSYRTIIAQAHGHLKAGGALILEIGHDQKEAVYALADQAGRYQGYGCTPDYAGRDRVVVLQKKIANPQSD